MEYKTIRTLRGVTLAPLLMALGCSGSVQGGNDVGPGDAGTDQEIPDNGCPVGFGPSMVRVPAGYCIDSTEVTRSQYQAWLAVKPIYEEGDCVFLGNNFRPDTECMSKPEVCPGEACGAHPQVCVSQCHAAAFCNGSGKRLCFGPGGPSQNNQWLGVCTQGGTTQYPWGDDPDPSRCNLEGATTHPVGNDTRCQSATPGFEGIYDLIGNVAEWTGRCSKDDAGWLCDAAGGDFRAQADACTGTRFPMFSELPSLGFRCCAD